MASKLPVGIRAAWIIGTLTFLGMILQAAFSKPQISVSGNDNQVLTNSRIENYFAESPSTKRNLSELNNKTSGITQLPDGRLRLGRQLSGMPTVVLGSHEAARQAFKSHDYASALAHSQQAIKAYEETQNISN